MVAKILSKYISSIWSLIYVLKNFIHYINKYLVKYLRQHANLHKGGKMWNCACLLKLISWYCTKILSKWNALRLSMAIMLICIFKRIGKIITSRMFSFSCHLKDTIHSLPSQNYKPLEILTQNTMFSKCIK